MSHAAPDPVPPAPIGDLLAHRGRVTALARRLVSAADADDVAQETWLSALRRPPRADGTADRWLLRVARNAALKLRRGSSRRVARDAVAAHARRGVEEAPDVVLAHAESHRRVVEAVLRLEEPYRSTVLLRWFEDVEVAEIARRHGCPVETVRTRLKRAHAQLRDLLGGDGDAGDARPPASRLHAVLLPLVGREGAVTKTTTGGLAAMAVGWKICTAAALVIAGAFLWWNGPTTGVGETTAASAGPAPLVARARPVGSARAGSSPGIEAKADGALAATPGNEASARPPRLLRVTDDRGYALRDVRATVLGEERAPGTPAPDGSVSLAASDAPRRALVIAPGRPPCVVDVPPGDGTLDIALPGGASLSGVVRIDGRAPTEPVVLQFGYADARSFVGEEAGVAISPHYAQGFEPHRAGAVTGEGGRFRFDGLPATAPGGIRIPDWLAFRDRPALVRATDVPIPGDEILLDLVAFPRVRGRVTSGGAPLVGAFVRVEWTTADGGRSSRTRVVEPDGSFLRPVECLDPRDVQVVVSDPDDRTEHPVAVPSPLSPVTEIGAVEIEAAVRARLRVVGADGRPLAGAVVVTGPGGTHVEGVTDADGGLEFAAVGGHASVTVAARGFAPAAATWDAGSPVATHEIRLEPAPLLAVRYDARGAAGPRNHVRLKIEGPQGAVGAATDAVEAARAAAGASPVMASRRAPEVDAQWYVFAGAVPEWIVEDLAADVPCRFSVIDDFGTCVAAGDLALAPGERRSMTITPSAAARTITVTVTDESGRPLGGAEVRVSDAAPPDEAGPQLCYLPAGDDGRAVFGGFRGERAAVLVEHPGRAAWVEPSLVVGADGLTLAVRLPGERRLVVRVTDEAGHPVAGADVEVTVPRAPESGAAAISWSGDETAPGVHEVGGVPEGVLSVTAATQDGRSGSAQAAPGATEVTVTLRDAD